jgi:hypothetical protein
MFNSGVLNVVIGLVFIFLLYSLLATIIQELFATIISMRASLLKKGIARMLDDNKTQNSISTAFYQHPLIKYLGGNKLHKEPSYLTAQNFSKVFLDMLRGDSAKPGQNFGQQIQEALNLGEIKWGTGTIGTETLSYLKSIWADAQGDVEKFRIDLEKWFDDTMERSSGWYKRWTQVILLCIGLILAIAFNIDSIEIAKKLTHDPKAAAQLANNASIYIQNHKELGTMLQQKSPGDAVSVSDSANNADSLWNAMVEKSNILLDSANTLIQENINDANHILGLGWKSERRDKTGKIITTCNFEWYTIFGWIITALAISLGAPFWFDLLNKLMKMRNSVAISTPDDKQKQQESKSSQIKRVG